MSIMDMVNPYATAIKVGVVVLILGTAFGAGWKVNGDRWEAKYQKLQAEYDQFKGGVAALGEAAKAKTKATESANKLAQRRANEQNTSTIATLRADIKRLRDEADRTRGSLVPRAPAGSSRPDLACFDRAALESADREFLAEIRGQADKGTEATVNLDTAKSWAMQLKLSTTLKE